MLNDFLTVFPLETYKRLFYHLSIGGTVMEYEKKAINEMVNDIYEQSALDYIYLLVKDCYRSCYEQDLKQFPVDFVAIEESRRINS